MRTSWSSRRCRGLARLAVPSGGNVPPTETGSLVRAAAARRRSRNCQSHAAQHSPHLTQRSVCNRSNPRRAHCSSSGTSDVIVSRQRHVADGPAPTLLPRTSARRTHTERRNSGAEAHSKNTFIYRLRQPEQCDRVVFCKTRLPSARKYTPVSALHPIAPERTIVAAKAAMYTTVEDELTS